MVGFGSHDNVFCFENVICGPIEEFLAVLIGLFIIYLGYKFIYPALTGSKTPTSKLSVVQEV
jgi:hypothetical protein